MTKRMKFEDVCKAVLDILQEKKGVGTNVICGEFSRKTGRYYLTDEMRPKLNRMKKEGLIKATYHYRKGYRWWLIDDDITLKENEVIVDW